MTIDDTLKERGTHYGEFCDHARIAQALKSVMHGCLKWHSLAPDQKEALDMVQHKIARILNGDPDYIDSWHDIIGYVRLVEVRLEKEKLKKDFPLTAALLNSPGFVQNCSK